MANHTPVLLELLRAAHLILQAACMQSVVALTAPLQPRAPPEATAARAWSPSCTPNCSQRRFLQMFTTNGQASRVSIVKEIIIGSALGTALGFWWQT